MNIQLSFDGFGFNDKLDAYCARIATFSDAYKNDKGRDMGREIEKRVNNYPALIDLLERASAKLNDYSAETNGDLNDSLASEIYHTLDTLK